MSNPFLELQRLIVRPALQTSGTIIEVLQNQTYRVRTTSGSLEVKASGNAAYGAGDEVIVRDGLIQGRVRSISSIPTYNV